MNIQEREQIEGLWRQVVAIEKHIIETSADMAHLLEKVHPQYALSARNLLRYVALRQLDLRKLQIDLQVSGLSLSQCERHVLHNVRKVKEKLAASIGMQFESPSSVPSISWKDSKQLVHQHSRDVIATPVENKPATELHHAIMVTLDLSWDREDFTKAYRAGASILRINAAHGTPAQWQEAISTWRELTQTGLVMVDVAGPKMRSNSVHMPSPVLRYKVDKDFRGDATDVTFVRVSSSDKDLEISHEEWRLPPSVDLNNLDSIEAIDRRGRKRAFKIQKSPEKNLHFEVDRGCYFEVGCEVVCKSTSGRKESLLINRLLGVDDVIFLSRGDIFDLIVPSSTAISPTDRPVVECQEPRLIPSLTKGQRILFDDGRIEAVVEREGEEKVELRVTHAIKTTTTLRKDKGINLPGSNLSMPLLDEEDLNAAKFAIDHSDIVSFSFIRSAKDVEIIHKWLEENNAPETMPVVLKIETAEAFSEMPAILLQAMRRYPVSIMIARGDLAVEVGYVRSGEVQEQLLDLVEAAHLPVILATEVLGQMLKTGSPSRAEVTDAAMAVRAECIMLNKGEYVAETVSTLKEILLSMQMHRYKNLEIYRPTSWSKSLG